MKVSDIVTDTVCWYRESDGNPLHRAWWTAVCVFQSHLDPRDKWRDVRDFWQRGHRGWADNDTMDLNSYLAGVIAGSVACLRDNEVGMPVTLHDEDGNLLYDLIPRWEGDDPAPAGVVTDSDTAAQMWRDRLGKIAKAFQDYKNFDDAHTVEQMVENDKLRPEVMRAMRLFLQDFDALWS